jgi:two-component system, NarL family, invasion response regulator UvrY
MSERIYTLALADDHTLFRESLVHTIVGFGRCQVIIQASSGKELIEKIEKGPKPDLILLDLNMGEMNGYDAAEYLLKNHPEINILMLTMYDADIALVRLLQLGIKGFLRKDIHPAELKTAIFSIMESGYYYSSSTTGKLFNLFRRQQDNGTLLQKTLLNETEITFLKLACTEDTYKEIAQKMNLNPRSIDNLRDHLFDKLEVKSRVGLAMYALKQGIIIP